MLYSILLMYFISHYTPFVFCCLSRHLQLLLLTIYKCIISDLVGDSSSSGKEWFNDNFYCSRCSSDTKSLKKLMQSWIKIGTRDKAEKLTIRNLFIMNSYSYLLWRISIFSWWATRTWCGKWWRALWCNNSCRIRISCDNCSRAIHICASWWRSVLHDLVNK